MKENPQQKVTRMVDGQVKLLIKKNDTVLFLDSLLRLRKKIDNNSDPLSMGIVARVCDKISEIDDSGKYLNQIVANLKKRGYSAPESFTQSTPKIEAMGIMSVFIEKNLI